MTQEPRPIKIGQKSTLFNSSCFRLSETIHKMGKLLKFVIFLMQLINELDKVLCFIGIRLYPLTRSSILWGMYVFQLFAFTCIIDLTIN